MPKTLLDAVNETLKRTGVITGGGNELVSLSSTARQRDIDVAIQVINEGIDELYSLISKARPNQQTESTFTLVVNTRSYTLQTDLVRLRWPLIDKTNNQFIYEYPKGYNAMLMLDPEQDDTGLPYYGAISPVDGALHLDHDPTSLEAGRIYTYQYDKDTGMSAAADTVPFNDTTFRAMVAVWGNLWKRDRRGQEEFDTGLYQLNLGRAARAIRQRPPRTSHNPRRAA